MNDNFNSKLMFDNISYLIKEQGKKVGEVETQAGVSAGYISRNSKDSNSKPGIDFLFRVSEILNTSIDTIMKIPLSELTPTERYLVSFFEKLKADTAADKILWERESKEYLNQLEPDINGFVNHSLFSYETCYVPSETDYPDQVDKTVFVSKTFGNQTVINGDCYNVRLKNGVRLYLMNIVKIVHQVNDSDATALEAWMMDNSGGQCLCGTQNDQFLADLLIDLYNTVHEVLRHPQLSNSFRCAIDAFMNDDISDDSGTDDYPF